MENNKPENPQAFPFEVKIAPDEREIHYGMTLRDYFAAKAINGIISNTLTMQEITKAFTKANQKEKTFYQVVSDIAYEYADAMLKQREQC